MSPPLCRSARTDDPNHTDRGAGEGFASGCWNVVVVGRSAAGRDDGGGRSTRPVQGAGSAAGRSRRQRSEGRRRQVRRHASTSAENHRPSSLASLVRVLAVLKIGV